MTSAARYLNGTYFGENPEWHEGDSERKARKVADMLSRQGICPTSICDVGCGTGGVLDHLSRIFPESEMVGFEPSVQAIGLASADRSSRVRLVNGDASTINGFFDVVLLLDVIEHVEDYFSLMRAVSDKGHATVFHVPLALSVQVIARNRPLLESRTRVGHIHYFTRDTALAAIRDCGFEVVKDEYTMMSIDPSPGSSRLGTRIARIPRRYAYRRWPHLANRVLGGSSLLVLAVPKNRQL